MPIGKAATRREGTDITVIAYGLSVQHAMKAAAELDLEGVSTELLDLRTLHPLDQSAIYEAAAKTGKVLIVHEDNKTGGIGAEISAMLAEHLLYGGCSHHALLSTRRSTCRDGANTGEVLSAKCGYREGGNAPASGIVEEGGHGA